ncbi:hypothetical protein HPB47_014936 [Ixodes persulcatus]|uniref:Uncharacterized protein n=1 Tax=Ixodes persulcatus TaxID=34615 RepID=A0AC60QUT3_IXOPE|nr:hypothetical protein HPB47_014936 [Ixodes persulcatus]
MFRFRKEHIGELQRALLMPETITSAQGVKMDGEEALFVTLRRLAYPNRWVDLEGVFGRHSSVLSSVTSRVMLHINNTFGHLLDDLNIHRWLDVAKLEHMSRKALLLHCLWVKGQRIFYTLPETRPPILGLREPPEGQKTPTALDKCDVALAVLGRYFAATSNEFDARHRFGQRVQLPGESIDTFFAELRDLSLNCEFGAMVDDFIQDQLVAKTSIQQLRERLLLEGTCLTPDCALVIGCLVEETVRYSKELVSASAMQKVDAKPRRSADQPRVHGKRNIAVTGCFVAVVAYKE